MIFILLFIVSTNKLGIGLGTYPNGLISLKYRSNPELLMQFTVGTSTWHHYHKYWRTLVTVGGRLAFQVGEGGDGFKYMHLVGIGAGLHSYNYENGSKLVMVGEGFYEFELLPNPTELPLSLGLGFGILGGIDWLDVAIFPSIHFYFKPL